MDSEIDSLMVSVVPFRQRRTSQDNRPPPLQRLRTAPFRFAVKPDSVFDASDVANEALVFIAVFEGSEIAFMNHGIHGCMI